MNNWINSAKLCFALGLILTTLNCGQLLTQSECELTETDGRNILGINVNAIDKSNPALGDPEKAKNDKNFRACGYIAEKPDEDGKLFWAQTHSENIQQAERLFGVISEPLPNAEKRSVEDLPEIGEEAKLSLFKKGDFNKLEIAVRKGRNVFLISVSKPAASEIPTEQVKALAARIAAKTDNY